MKNNDLPDVSLEGSMDNFGGGGNDGGDEGHDGNNNNGPLKNPLLASAKQKLGELNASRIG